MEYNGEVGVTGLLSSPYAFVRSSAQFQRLIVQFPPLCFEVVFPRCLLSCLLFTFQLLKHCCCYHPLSPPEFILWKKKKRQIIPFGDLGVVSRE